MNAADVEQGREVPLDADGFDTTAPVLGARHVLCVVAGRDEPATDFAHPHGVRDITRRGRRDGHIQPGHPLIDTTHGGQREALQSLSHDLQVVVVSAACDLGRVLSRRECQLGIVPDLEAQLRLTDREPAMLRGLGKGTEEVARPTQPAQRHSLTETEEQGVPSQRCGGPGSAQIVAEIAVSPVRVLP